MKNMRKKIIQLPKGYISYSQRELWLNDRARYIEIYFEGRDELRTSNAGQEYGKVVATALEYGTETGDLLTDSAMLLLPKYDMRDQEIVTYLKTKDGEIKLLGRPDTLNSITKEFREYKTGKLPWTQKKAQQHPQMRFYAMLIYLAFGKALREAHLDWIETEQTPTGIAPTGRVQSFKVTFTLSDILKEMALTTKVAKEIEVMYACHVQDPAMKKALEVW